LSTSCWALDDITCSSSNVSSFFNFNTYIWDQIEYIIFSFCEVKLIHKNWHRSTLNLRQSILFYFEVYFFNHELWSISFYLKNDLQYKEAYTIKSMTNLIHIERPHKALDNQSYLLVYTKTQSKRESKCQALLNSRNWEWKSDSIRKENIDLFSNGI